MNYRKFTTIVLAAVAFAACSQPERESDPAPAAGTTRVTLLREGSAGVSVYAFRRQGAEFLYDTLFREGWKADGTLAVRMANGSYKFLFASGAAGNLTLEPAPFVRGTAWEEAAFALRGNPALPGTCLPSDELFLQLPASDANTVYTVGGTDLTIPARLTRAVGRIGITLKRGYRDGDRYVEVPYTRPHTILDEIARIDLRVSNAGLRVSPGGSEGTAEVTATLDAEDYAELTDEGFVRLDGPFVIPPADGRPVGLDISVTPAAGSSLQPGRLQLTGTVERNKRLDVTLWITSGYPAIGIEVRTAPIGDEQDGDTGIWE